MQKPTVFNISSMNLSSKEAGQFLREAQDGNQEALGSLYTLMFDKIFRFVFYRVSHKETAEDLTEEIFIKAFRNLKNLDKHGAFEGWLYTIARNTVIDYYRNKKTTVALEEVENTLTYESTIIDTLNLEVDQKFLLTALKQLPPEQQIVLRLKFLEELNNSEISELLHKSEGSIRVIQFRGLQTLKALLAGSNHSDTHV